MDELQDDVAPYVLTPFTDEEFRKFFGYDRPDAERVMQENERTDIAKRKQLESARARSKVVSKRNFAAAARRGLGLRAD